MKYCFFKKFFCWSIPLTVLFLLGGCCRILPSQKGTPYRVVTQIQVVYENGSLETQRQVFQEVKMRPILDYLRYLDPYGIPREDPERTDGSDCFITLHYSDGSQRIYRQRADRYICIDDGPWTRIDQAKAMELKMLLWMIPSDPAPALDEPIPPLLCPKI